MRYALLWVWPIWHPFDSFIMPWRITLIFWELRGFCLNISWFLLGEGGRIGRCIMSQSVSRLHDAVLMASTMTFWSCEEANQPSIPNRDQNACVFILMRMWSPRLQGAKRSCRKLTRQRFWQWNLLEIGLVEMKTDWKKMRSDPPLSGLQM